jgi:hypothetical protein
MVGRDALVFIAGLGYTDKKNRYRSGRSLLFYGLFVNRFLQQLRSVVEIQLLIFFASVPVLAAWGMPLSVWSILGNCLFAPIFALFLFVSMLLIICMPIPLLASGIGYLLNWLVYTWKWLLALRLPGSFFALPWIGYVLAAVLFSVFVISLHLLHISNVRRFCYCFLVYVAIYLVFGLVSLPQSASISCGGARLVLSKIDNQLCLIDNGMRRQTRGLASWTQYRLSEFLARTFGCVRIDTYRITRLTPSAVNTFSALCQRSMVKRIVIQRAKNTIEERLQQRIITDAADAGVIVVYE